MIRLRMLGPIELTGRDGAELRSLLAQPKRTALLAYLAVEAPRGFQRRDTLLGLFWPDFDETRARAALSRALHFLRRGLGEETLPGRGDGELTVDPARVWCDVAAFEQARAAGAHAEALALYRGDLLEGLLLDEVPEFERWLLHERRRLRLAAAASAGAVATAFEEQGDLPGAIAAARRRHAIDPHDEPALRQLLALLDRVGDRAGAVAAYESAAARLAADLGVEPSAETRAMLDRIRRESPAAPPTSRPAPAPIPVPLPVPIPVPIPVPTPVPTPAEPTAAPGRRRRWLRTAAVASLVVVLVAATAWWARGGRMPTAAEPPVIAVLPFADLSAAHDQAYLGEGLADELIGALGGIHGVDVVARTSSFAFRGRQAPVGDIARELHATHVLEGSVRREGRRLRVSVQLVDAGTGYRVWSRTFDEDPRDVLAVQDEIGRQVVAAIGPRFAARAIDARPRRVPVDPATYDLYLQGRYLYLNAGTFDSLQNARAIESFRKAIARDSSYAPAWAGLADVLGRIGETKPQREAAERALALDTTLADAHASLAHVLAFGERRWDEALREIDRALELSPGSVYTLLRRSSIYSALSRDAEAIADIDQAFRLDPLSPAVTQRRAAIYSAAGRWDDAIRIYRTLLTERPDQPEIHEALALTYLAKGAGDSAAAEFLAERWPWDGKFISDTVAAAVARNDRAQIMRFIREGEAGTFPNGRISPLAMASLYTRVGDRDKAFAMLERAHAETMGYRALLLGVVRDPRLIPLRDDPRFKALAARWMAP